MIRKTVRIVVALMMISLAFIGCSSDSVSGVSTVEESSNSSISQRIGIRYDSNGTVSFVDGKSREVVNEHFTEVSARVTSSTPEENSAQVEVVLQGKSGIPTGITTETLFAIDHQTDVVTAYSVRLTDAGGNNTVGELKAGDWAIVTITVTEIEGSSFTVYFNVRTAPVGQRYVPAQMVKIPAQVATFTMGKNGVATPVHAVTFTTDFWMGRTEVTQDEYEAVMGTNPSYFKISSNHPVEQVTWFNAIEYCNRKSEIEGRTPCYDLSTGACDFTANGYRLPTEAEWEYACRVGTTTEYYWGNDWSQVDNYAWYDINSGSQPHKVGEKTPNAYGLYDMSGNVWEWCNDWYAGYSADAVTDPRGPSSGSNRVVRGGGWGSSGSYLRSAFRYLSDPSISNFGVGFRVCYSH